MAFHVVTNRCFLACEKVCSVVIEEIIPDKPMPRKKRKQRISKKKGAVVLKKKKITAKPLEVMPRQFSITIGYYPLSTTANPNSRSDSSEYSLDLRILGKKEAYALYGQIIKEVQEQHPTDGYLDKLVSDMLGGVDFEVGEPEEEADEDYDDP